MRTILSARRDTVLTLQDLISQKLVFIDEITSQLQETQSQIQQMLFATDSPPIWKLFGAPRDSAQQQVFAPSLWTTKWDALTNYYSRYKSRFVDQLVVAIVLLLLLIALAWQARRWSVEDDEDLVVAVAILKRPIALALLLVLLFPGVFHPRAPSSLYDLAQILLLLPLLRLLPALTRPEARWPVYFVVVIFAFDQAIHLAPDHSGLQRTLQILLAGLSIAGLAWLLRLIDSLRGAAGWVGTPIFLIRVAILLLGLSILGNVFGYSSLANHLLAATMSSGYYAIVLTAAYRVAKAVIAAVLQTKTARKLRGIRLHTPLIKRRVYRFVQTAAVLVWIYAVLFLFDLWEICWQSLLDLLGKDWTFGTVAISIGDVLVFFFAIWLAVQISKFTSFVLSEDILPHFRLARGVPSAITRVSGMLIVGFGFVLAAAAAGIDLNQFTLLAGALGVGIGFGMQNIVNNFVSGLILVFERPISAGDLIQYGNMWGTVQRIGFRSSTIRTFSGADVIVPNGNLISTEVTNWSRSDQLRRVEVKVGVAYGTNPDTVIEVLEKTIAQHPDVLKEPQPYAVFHGFGDSSLDFEIRGWTHLDDWLRVSTEVRVMVNNAIVEAGIEIPFPQRDLHLRTVDPKVEDALAGRKRQPAAEEHKAVDPSHPSDRATHTGDQDLDGD
jgi:small-conductance mechanosensitive channel